MPSICLTILLTLAITNAFPHKRATINDCLDSAKVPQLPPGSTNFTQAIKPFNLRLPYTPTAVALPSNVTHVRAAVSCGASLGVMVSAKSGGHSYASHGIGGENGHLMIDLKYFNTVSLDNDTKVATIGPAARLGNVASALYSQGKRGFSHGTCPGVGVGGHVLHGGYGFSSRTHGLALDALVEATVVLANSTIVTASDKINSDLFWALRGAGSSYGIVTSMKFKTFAAPESNIVFTYTFSWNRTEARAAIEVIQSYTNSTMPSELNMRLFITSAQTSLMGVYYGSQDSFNATMQPLLSQLGVVRTARNRTLGWLDTLTEYANGRLATPLEYDVHETFFAKSLFTTSRDALTADAMDSFVGYWYNVTKTIPRAWYLIVDLHGGPSSAITKVPAGDTSYAHRDALFKYQFYDRDFSGKYPDNGFSFLNGWVDSIRNTMNNTTFGMYINYADPTLSAKEAHKVYWLDHYSRLSSIKETYDPNQVFSNPQAVLRT